MLRRALPVLLALVVACDGARRDVSDATEPLLVFAASDLRDALGEVAALHRRTGGDSAVLVFGSSGDLRAQIAAGAPADLFFSADARAVDELEAAGRIVPGSRQVYAIGRLAVAWPPRADDGDSVVMRLESLAEPHIRTVAIANPAHAPYGRAAKQALERAGLWARVEPKLVLGATVSHAEQMVRTGNADAGLVALSLVRRGAWLPYALVDSALHDPLRQTVAIVATTTRQRDAEAFLRTLANQDGQAIMRRFGFDEVPPDSAVAGARADSLAGAR